MPNVVCSRPVGARLCFQLALVASIIAAAPAAAQVSRLSGIELPDGFSIGFFAEGVTGARSLAQSPTGTVFVGTRQAGLVHALVDSDDDGAADEGAADEGGEEEAAEEEITRGAPAG